MEVHRHGRVTTQDVVVPIYIRVQDGILRACYSYGSHGPQQPQQALDRMDD